MRIISGKYKGRRINPPKNLPVRPTTDMSKESLFNILNNYFNFSELRVLDLFAGTGNISYEFASRGSGPITSVDGDFGCVNFIKKTAKEFDFDITALKAMFLNSWKKARLPMILSLPTRLTGWKRKILKKSWSLFSRMSYWKPTV